MVEPTSPKNIVSRSLRTNEIDQLEKKQSDVQQNHVGNKMKNTDKKRKDQVIKSEETDYKKIRDQEQENKENKKDKKEDKEREESEKKKETNNLEKGNYLDIKI